MSNTPTPGKCPDCGGRTKATHEYTTHIVVGEVIHLTEITVICPWCGFTQTDKL